jgi:hypothetical protein
VVQKADGSVYGDGVNVAARLRGRPACESLPEADSAGRPLPAACLGGLRSGPKVLPQGRPRQAGVGSALQAQAQRSIRANLTNIDRGVGKHRPPSGCRTRDRLSASSRSIDASASRPESYGASKDAVREEDGLAHERICTERPLG